MQILGHSQITRTLGTYSHVVPELAHDAAQRMANVLWPASPEQNSDQLAATLAARSAQKPFDQPRSDGSSALTSKNVVGPVGLEPTTRGLQVRCSASLS
jgi:hypothetical protein